MLTWGPTDDPLVFLETYGDVACDPETLHLPLSFVHLVLTPALTHWGIHFIVQATQSALINVCVCNEKLVLARQVYGETRAMGLRPHLHAFNSLINAYACNFRLGDVVSSCRSYSQAPYLGSNVLQYSKHLYPL